MGGENYGKLASPAAASASELSPRSLFAATQMETRPRRPPRPERVFPGHGGRTLSALKVQFPVPAHSEVFFPAAVLEG